MALKKLNIITPQELKNNGVVALADRPNVVAPYGTGNLTPTQLKLWFDKLATLLADRYNILVGVLSGNDAAAYLQLQLEGLYPDSEDDEGFVYSLQDLISAIKDGKLAAYLKAYTSASKGELKTLQEIINNIDRKISELGEKESTNEQAIADETTRAGAAEAANKKAIEDEATRATGAENANAKSIADEIKRATGAEATNKKAIDDEVTRARAAESANTKSITSEVSRATEAEEAIRGELQGLNLSNQEALADEKKELSGKIDTEKTRATTAESEIAGNLATETSRAQGAEKKNADALTAEVSRAKEKEQALAELIDDINSKIPAQASESNQIADKDFVNSSIQKLAATPRGSYATKAALDAWQKANPKVATNHDYATVLDDETHDHECWRYTYSQPDDSKAGTWVEDYRVNEKPLTAAQVKALDSGITAEKIAAMEKATADEITRAEAAEATNKKAIEDEATRATGAENANAKSIADEVKRATGAEATNKKAIDDEVTRATGKENNIEKKADDNADAILKLQERADKIEEKNASQDSAITDAQAAAETAQQTATGKYFKPDEGIPESDLSKEVQRKLNEGGGGGGTLPFGKIYGVSGMGSINPVWQRTYDAAGVSLTLEPQTDNENLIQFVLSDAGMQDFFDFKETTDEKGNVFIIIPPLSFKYDRIHDNEVEALSVKHYEDGDEEYGYEMHPAFRKWTSNTEYDGYGSIQIAKYMSAPLDTVTGEPAEDWLDDRDENEIKVRSVAGCDYTLSFVDWDKGMAMIKATDPTYHMLHWMYRDVIVKLACIFFARADIYNMLEATPDYYDCTTGNTDQIATHSGFNRDAGQIKLFNIDCAFAATNLNGEYRNSDDVLYYTHLIDTDSKNDDNYAASSLVVPSAYADGNFAGSITKISVDENERALSCPSANLQIDTELCEEASEPKNHSEYYCSRFREWGTPSERGQVWAFQKYVNDGGLFTEDGLFFVYLNWCYDDAWDSCYRGALRLCKEPS